MYDDIWKFAIQSNRSLLSVRVLKTTNLNYIMVSKLCRSNQIAFRVDDVESVC